MTWVARPICDDEHCGHFACALSPKKCCRCGGQATYAERAGLYRRIRQARTSTDSRDLRQPDKEVV